jgi:hypothetical protein
LKVGAGAGAETNSFGSATLLPGVSSDESGNSLNINIYERRRLLSGMNSSKHTTPFNSERLSSSLGFCSLFADPLFFPSPLILADRWKWGLEVLFTLKRKVFVRPVLSGLASGETY